MSYWVYVHDEHDDMVRDLGSTKSLEDAMNLVAQYFFYTGLAVGNTIRIVSDEEDATVWKAGPIV